MLLGEFRHTLDAKGRVILPARWREDFGESLVITLGLDGCLYLMTTTQFNQVAERFNQWSLESPQARAYTRLFFAKASEEAVDAQGRITIPGHLREVAGLDKELILSGAGTRAEVWNRSRYETYLGGVQEQYEEIAQQLL